MVQYMHSHYVHLVTLKAHSCIPFALHMHTSFKGLNGCWHCCCHQYYLRPSWLQSCPVVLAVALLLSGTPSGCYQAWPLAALSDPPPGDKQTATDNSKPGNRMHC